MGIRDETFDVQLPSLQEIQADAAALASLDLAPELSISVVAAFAIHRFKLDPIISEIKLLFYHLPGQISAYSWPADLESAQNAIRRRLEDWRREINSLLNVFTQDVIDEDHQLDMRRYELTAHSQFFAAMILLYQPSQMISHPSEDALLICYQCAASRINIFSSLYSADGLLQSWRNVQGIFSSGATMIYCLWSSSSVQKSVPLSRAMTDLRTCTNLLSVGGEWWPSVKKGKETFGRAMDALAKKLDPYRVPSRTKSNVRNHNERLARDVPRQSDKESAKSESLTPATSTYSRDMDSFWGFNPALPSGFNGISHNDASTNDETTDWATLDKFGDQSLQFSQQSFDSAVSETVNTENLDSTVEAFINEFLQNDTAWNPF